ncbi:MAG: hypothetical protein ABFS56_33085 [Pseudomonadota bacterium]
MKLKTSVFLIAATFALTAMLAPITGAADEAAKKAAIVKLVRALGYGGAIHNFKNYVLRGYRLQETPPRSVQGYHDGATAGFALAQEAIKDFRKAGPSRAESAALRNIAGVVSNYMAAIAAVQKMIAEGKSAEEIDKAVKISDGPAVKGIHALRKGRTWNASENAEYALGYGNAIHQFKNYVLRGDNRYNKTKARLIKAKIAMKSVKGNKKAVDKVLTVIKAYTDALETVKKMAGSSSSAKDIDKAVSISDGPAFDGLAQLR